LKPGSVFRLQNLFFVLCLIFSAVGWAIVFADDALLFHNLYLQPIAGVFLYVGIRGRQKGHWLFVSAILCIFAGIFFMTVFFESVMDLYLHLLLGIPCAVLLLLGFALAFLASLFREKKQSVPKGLRVIAGIAAMLILIVLLAFLRLAFGDPVTALIHKSYLDSWMEEHLDEDLYAADGFHYTWYDGVYYYVITEKSTGGKARLTYFKNSDTIYFDGTDREYENTYH